MKVLKLYLSVPYSIEKRLDMLFELNSYLYQYCNKTNFLIFILNYYIFMVRNK